MRTWTEKLHVIEVEGESVREAKKSAEKAVEDWRLDNTPCTKPHAYAVSPSYSVVDNTPGKSIVRVAFTPFIVAPASGT